MSGINRKLDILLEDVSAVGPATSALDSILNVSDELHKLKQKIAEMENQLATAKDRINGDLAMGVRRKCPGLNVSLDRNGCKVGYKSKQLSLSPDIQTKVWTVKSPDMRFSRRFCRRNGPQLALMPDLDGIIGSIANYFMSHYKTLGEDINGTGKLLIEGRSATLLDLAEWRDDNRGTTA
jgi:hypothetical protein|tara:strand:+ start:225 stop:764 length:540 start_codon:yes stop_codon:yes gene_type:complete